MENTPNLVTNLVQLNQLAIFTVYLNTTFYKIL
jgi:hypothetical protein